MTKDDDKPTKEQRRMIESAKQIYGVLKEWASSGARIIYSASGLRFEGKITLLREPEDDSWGIFDASFVFTAKAAGIQAFIRADPLMNPGLKLRTVGDTTYLDLKTDCSVHANQLPMPSTEVLEKVVAQLKTWALCGTRVWVYLDFEFSAFGSLCTVEVVNEKSFAFSAVSSDQSFDQTFIAHPTLSPRASLEDIDGTPLVKFSSVDGVYEMAIFEASRKDVMTRMISKLIQ